MKKIILCLVLLVALVSIICSYSYAANAIGATITGTVQYNGSPITNYTDTNNTVKFFVRDEDTGQGVTLSSPPAYNTSNGIYSIDNIPPGKYGIEVQIDVSSDHNNQPFPGDYYGWTSPIIVGTDTVNKDLACNRIIHLTSPVDNSSPIGSIGIYPLLPPPTQLFKWGPILEAAHYQYRIEKCSFDQNNNFTCNDLIYGDIPGSEVNLTLSPSAPNENYMFTLFAINDSGSFVGQLMVVYNNGYGWDYRFRIGSASFTLTYTAGPHGWISGPSPQSKSYGGNGDPVTAVSNPGYYFSGWSDSSTNNPRTDKNVNADVQVIANFDVDNYTLLTMASPAGGTYSKDGAMVSLNSIGIKADNIYYTTDGSDPIIVPDQPDPNISSKKYTYPISITSETMLKFFAVKAGEKSEAIKSEYYTINLDLANDLSTPATSVTDNGPIPMTMILNFGTSPVTTFRPDFGNTNFEMIGPNGLVPSLCRIRKAYGPGDVTTIELYKSTDPEDPLYGYKGYAIYKLDIDLAQMFDPSILSGLAPGTQTITATHSNFIEINPNLDSGQLLWTGAVASNPVNINKLTYTFSGFFKPVKNHPAMNTARAGRTIPFKWRIADQGGLWISDPASFVSLTSTQVDCKKMSNILSSETPEIAAGSPGLKYLGKGKWRLRWATPQGYAGQCRQVKINLNDGTAHPANIQFMNQDRDRDWDDDWPEDWHNDGSDDRHGD